MQDINPVDKVLLTAASEHDAVNAPSGTGSPTINLTSDAWFLKRLSVEIWRNAVLSACASEPPDDGATVDEGTLTPTCSSSRERLKETSRLVRSNSGWWQDVVPQVTEVPKDDKPQDRLGSSRARPAPLLKASPNPNPRTTSWSIYRLVEDSSDKTQSLPVPGPRASRNVHSTVTKSTFDSCLFLPDYIERFLPKPPVHAVTWTRNVRV